MAITGWGDKTAEEMRVVVQEHGITSFKVFMAYKAPSWWTTASSIR